jgi:Tfp pilus assembly protein FimV
MTTIGMTAAGIVQGPTRHADVSARRTRLRLTRRGRRVVAGLAALPAVAGIVAALAIGGGAAFAARDAGAPVHFRTVTVEPGQSLWAIAEEVAPQADPRDVVDGIVRLNALNGVTVDPGQELAIPTQYSSGR